MNLLMKKSKKSLALKRYWRRFTSAQRSLIRLAGPLPTRKRSSLELVTAKGLKYLGIQFVEQPTIAGFRVDFYLPERNTVVEVDGKYYHTLWNRPVTDLKRDSALVAVGYTVVRLLEEDLKLDPLGAIIKGIGDG